MHLTAEILRREEKKKKHYSWSIWKCKAKNHECNTLASGVTTGLGGNWTSVAFRMVFSCKMSCWDWLWPKGCKSKKQLKQNKTKQKAFFDTGEWKQFGRHLQYISKGLIWGIRMRNYQMCSLPFKKNGLQIYLKVTSVNVCADIFCVVVGQYVSFNEIKCRHAQTLLLPEPGQSLRAI